MCWVFLIFIRFFSQGIYIFTANLIYSKSQEGALHCYLPSLGGVPMRLLHTTLLTAELRVFGGLGVRKV